MVHSLPEGAKFDFLPREEIRAYQEERIRSVIPYAWNNIPFYRRLWQAAGMEPGDIKTLEDFNKIPTFALADMKKDLEDNPPFGSYHGISVQQACRIQSSGGTTGLPRPFLFSKNDWDQSTTIWSKNYEIAGMKTTDVVQMSFGLSTLLAGPSGLDGIIKYGATGIGASTGLMTSAELQVKLAQGWGTTVWVATPSFAIHLGNVARKRVGIDPRTVGIRTFITAAEPLPPATRRRIDEDWGCQTLDMLGCVEAGASTGVECAEYSNIHIIEDSFLYESINLETGKPVDEGEDGVLILTTIYPKEGAPMIRYNTMDVSQIITGQCTACGRNTIRIQSPLKGRVDDRIKFRGVYLYPPTVEEIVRAEKRLTGEFLIIADQINGEDELTVKIEAFGTETDIGQLAQELQAKIKNSVGLRMNIEILPEDEVRKLSLGFGGYKTTHFIDKRPKD